MKLLVVGPNGLDSVPVRITPGDGKTFRRYLADYDRLMASRPLKAQIPCDFEITPSDLGGATMKSNLPGDDDRAILLHRMRPFILDREPASFARVASLLSRRIPQPVVLELLSLQRRLWDGRSFASQGLIKVNGRKINPTRYVSTWLNAEEYHRDPEKAASFESLRRSAAFPLFEWIAMSLVTDKLRAISNVAALVGVLLRESPELRFGQHRLLLGDG